MMKLAWICYEYDDYDGVMSEPIILFSEPERYRYHTVIAIVYAELEKKTR